jgi:putative addiction module killer protein
MLELRYYLASNGGSPFEEWFSGLNAAAAAKVAVALARLEQGNFSKAKAVGEGVLEYRIDWGPGYRVYFGRDGDVLVILLTGGTKQRQQRDIDAAKTIGRITSGDGRVRNDGGVDGPDEELQGTGAAARCKRCRICRGAAA